jgi:anaerobic magnesium-protoporphyrin IX monomethyl ester cyclase
MTKPRILFVLTPDRDSSCNQILVNPSPQIGVASLIAYLKRFDIESDVLDTSFDFHNRFQHLQKRVAEFRPDLIGITLYSRLVDLGRLIIEDVRKITNVPIVAGGPHISSTREEMLREAPIDYGIMMDGEIPLKKLIKSLVLREGEVASIPGLIYRDSQGGLHVNEASELVQDLDELPLPDYSKFDTENYIATKHHSATVLTSRGCPFSCTFCNAHHVTGRKFRYFSAERVVGEIKSYYERGFKEINVGDDCFNVKLDRAKEILRSLIDLKLDIVLRFLVGMRANFGDPEFFGLMRKAGARQVGFGLEAGDPDVLKSIKKNLTIEKIREGRGPHHDG